MTSQQQEQLLQRLREEGITTTSTADDDISIVRVAAVDGSLSAFFLINNRTTNSTSASTCSDILYTKLDPYFAALSDESVDIDKIRNQVMPAYQKGCNAEGGMCPHISFETLAQNAAAGNLQCIDLKVEVNDHAKNGVDDGDDNDAAASTTTTTVLRLYYDESAVLKGRARNDIASKWTTTTATTLIKIDDDERTTMEFYGDVFVAAICQQDKTQSYYKSLTVQDVEEALQ